MSRGMNLLSSQFVKTEHKPGRYSDGAGLSLVIAKDGGKKWVFRYQRNGNRSDIGLGGYRYVSLAEARKQADKCRSLLAEGLDPLQAKRASLSVPTFGEMAERYVAAHELSWKNPKHRAQWRSTLATDAASLSGIPVDKVGVDDVLRVLKPIWQTKSETASRLQGRIERILDAAKASGFRTGENPARLKGHLENLLPKRQKLTRGHHAALPYRKVPEFMARLRKKPGVAALALQFAILTAARSGEVRGTTWSEIDLSEMTWVIPAQRMKAGRAHRVPLSDSAVEILVHLYPLSGDDPAALIFSGGLSGKPLSDAAFAALFARMGFVRGEVTAHGFRSSFKDWATEITDFPRELSEMALAHNVGDATERAYRRGDAVDKRRKLMADWAAFLDSCEKPSTE